MMTGGSEPHVPEAGRMFPRPNTEIRASRGRCCTSGEGGIRTPETVARLRDFQSRSFSHSDTSPEGDSERRTPAGGPLRPSSQYQPGVVQKDRQQPLSPKAALLRAPASSPFPMSGNALLQYHLSFLRQPSSTDFAQKTRPRLILPILLLYPATIGLACSVPSPHRDHSKDVRRAAPDRCPKPEFRSPWLRYLRLILGPGVL